MLTRVTIYKEMGTVTFASTASEVDKTLTREEPGRGGGITEKALHNV